MSQQISTPAPASGLASRISRRRQLYGFGVACLAPVLLTLLLAPMRESLGLDTVLLVFVLISVAASVLGGVLPALVASAVSFGLANFFFTRPYGSLLVANGSELIDLVIFAAVAALVGVVTEVGARARGRTERGRLEAEWLAELGSRDHGPNSVELALSEARAIYGMHEARLIEAGRVLVEASGRRGAGRHPARRARRGAPQPRAVRPRTPRRGPRPAEPPWPSRPGACGAPSNSPSRPGGPRSWRTSTSCAPACWPLSATTYATRWPRSPPPRPRCARPTSSSTRRIRPNCSRPSRNTPDA